jgi:ABC-type dipeptide/oligopeptide/nickel transport system ATPase subunit
MKIILKNCNNIDEGQVDITDGRLNIKYAINGTGKSTIALAITQSQLGDLSSLRPFKYQSDGMSEHEPKVESDTVLRKIAIFNESYVNNYVFKQDDELIENSFEIFVKTEKYDQHMSEIERLIADIKTAFKEDPEIEKLIVDLGTFVDSFGKAQNGYSKAGDLGKSLGKGNRLENIPGELKQYEPYLKSENGSVKWLKWQAEGKNYLDISDKCPYCVSEITTPKQTILKVSEEYDTKYLAALSKILDVFKSLNYYFSEETRKTIESIVINASGITDVQISFLKDVKNSAERLRDNLFDLKYMGFEMLKDVKKVVDELCNKRIDLNFYPLLKSVYTESKINKINNSLQIVIDKAGELQGQIAKQKIEIQRTIEKYKELINGFLSSAGYKYSVSIIPGKKEDYKLILTFGDGEGCINNVKDHLSYGERNAFALVLFMYQANKDKADLIILDDPISSFDNNKKYAVMSMLFRGQDSFQGKTVLMLTHDFEPVIDMIYNMPHYFCPKPVASYLGNINGCIEEELIEKDDIKSYNLIYEYNVLEAKDMIHKLIYLRRLLEVMGDKGLAWQMVSNIFHKDREKPKYQVNDGSEARFMTEQEYDEAEKSIQQKIPGFSYPEVYRRVTDRDELIRVYNESKNGYEKVQIYRILFDGEMDRGSALKKYIDESFHVQNDYLFQLNPCEYKIVPQYILDCCDEAVSELTIVKEVQMV